MDLLSPGLGLFVWSALAFLLVFFILGKFAWKPILKVLHERETGIAESIAAADRVRQEMGQMQAENERVLQQAREERTLMLREAKETRDRIVAEAKDVAKAEAAKIIADAQLQIHNQKMAAITDVKNEIGKLSVDVAEKILRKQLSTDEAQSAYNELLNTEVQFN